MTTINIPGYARPALQTQRTFRNGDSFTPDGSHMRFLQEEANRVGYVRTKRWMLGAPIPNIPGRTFVPMVGTSLGATWRFIFHSSTHARYLQIKGLLAKQNDIGTPLIEIDVAPINDSTIATATLYGGNNVAAPSDVPSQFSIQVSSPVDGDGELVELAPDTQYEVTVGANGARPLGVSIHEISLAADTDNGYLAQDASPGTPITAAQRQALIELVRDEWAIDGAPLILWYTNQDEVPEDYQRSTSSATKTNLVDDTSTAPGPETPGYWAQAEHKSTLSRGELVPCVIGAYGKCDGGTGHVYLTDADGTDLVDLEIPDMSGDEQWFTTTVNLPAELAKYDLRYASDGTNFTYIRAVTVYQHYAP